MLFILNFVIVSVWYKILKVYENQTPPKFLPLYQS
jgi:hypothetical protein